MQGSLHSSARGCAEAEVLVVNNLALPVCCAGPDCTAKLEVLADGQVGIVGLLLELSDLV